MYTALLGLFIAIITAALKSNENNECEYTVWLSIIQLETRDLEGYRLIFQIYDGNYALRLTMNEFANGKSLLERPWLRSFKFNGTRTPMKQLVKIEAVDAANTSYLISAVNIFSKKDFIGTILRATDVYGPERQWALNQSEVYIKKTCPENTTTGPINSTTISLNTYTEDGTRAQITTESASSDNPSDLGSKTSSIQSQTSPNPSDEPILRKKQKNNGLMVLVVASVVVALVVLAIIIAIALVITRRKRKNTMPATPSKGEVVAVGPKPTMVKTVDTQVSLQSSITMEEDTKVFGKSLKI